MNVIMARLRDGVWYAVVWVLRMRIIAVSFFVVLIRLFSRSMFVIPYSSYIFVSSSNNSYLRTPQIIHDCIGECVQTGKDRDGCPKIVNLGSTKTDLFYERKKYGFKKR